MKQTYRSIINAFIATHKLSGVDPEILENYIVDLIETQEFPIYDVLVSKREKWEGIYCED